MPPPLPGGISPTFAAGRLAAVGGVAGRDADPICDCAAEDEPFHEEGGLRNQAKSRCARLRVGIGFAIWALPSGVDPLKKRSIRFGR
jgi:hypothetical protein